MAAQTFDLVMENLEPEIAALSSLMTTTMPGQKEVIEVLRWL